MKRIRVKRLTDPTEDIYSDGEVLDLTGYGKFISIKTPIKEILIPISNIDYLVEEDV